MLRQVLIIASTILTMYGCCSKNTTLHFTPITHFPPEIMDPIPAKDTSYRFHYSYFLVDKYCRHPALEKQAGLFAQQRILSDAAGGNKQAIVFYRASKTLSSKSLHGYNQQDMLHKLNKALLFEYKFCDGILESKSQYWKGKDLNYNESDGITIKAID